MKNSIELIADERRRQKEEEGWTPEHDDQHDNSEMALAAACYAHPNPEREDGHYYVDKRDITPKDWPWSDAAYKPVPHDRVRQLVKAGALIAAEIDRINRKRE